MSADKRICPRCKGCGTLPPKKTRIYSKDRDKKWCNLCKKFLDRKEDFYGVTGYCKACQKNRIRINKKKFVGICNMCSKKFLGHSRYQVYCSRKCNTKSLAKKKVSKRYSSLPNDLRDQVLNEEGYI